MTKPQLCNKARYGAKGKPNNQFITLSLIPRVKALHCNKRMSCLPREQGIALAKALHSVSSAPEKHVYQDFPDGSVHQYQYSTLGHFQHDADGAYVLSIDGAQLKMGKKQGAWFAQITFLNLPSTSGRVTQEFTMLVGMFPGQPSDLNSFLRPIYVDLAKLSKGVWVDDAWAGDWTEIHGDLVAEAGDAPGQQKMHVHTGHRGTLGDLFTYVQAAKTKPRSGENVWPLTTPEAIDPVTGERTLLNATRPISYIGMNLPRRTEDDYLNILYTLEAEHVPTRRARLATKTGVMGLATGSFSPSFTYPAFWPLDPAHQV